MRKRVLAAVLGAAMIMAALTGCAGKTVETTAAAESTAAEASADTSSSATETSGAEDASSAATAKEGTDASSSATVKEGRYSLSREEIREEANKLVTTNDAGQIVVTHKYGETVMPENPQRIVSIKLEDIALALNVPLVAARNFEGFYLEDQLKELGVETIAVDEEANTINMEQVLSYKPDFIILRDSFDQSIYDELSKIAPTIAFHLQDAQVSLLGLGKALGMEEQAEARLDQYYAKIDEDRAKLEAVSGETVAMLRILKKEIRLYPYSKNDMSSFLYLDLGLTPDPMAVEYDNADNLAISMETLPDLTADNIILIAGYGTATAESDAAAKTRYDEIKADPLWQAVPAVQNGKVYEVDSRVWLTHGIIANEMKFDDVVRDLAGQS